MKKIAFILLYMSLYVTSAAAVDESLDPLISSGTTRANASGATTVTDGNDKPAAFTAFDPTMSLEEYKRACRSNRRTLRNVVWSYSNRAAKSLDIPEASLKVVGIVASLAFNDETNISLNKSGPMSIEFTDPQDDERAVLLMFRTKW